MRTEAKAVVIGTMLASLTAGCASITTGKEQRLTFDTDPAGADCTVTQAGIDIGRFQTPRMLSVRRANGPLVVACRKAGYHQTRAMISSTMSDGAWGNLVAGGVIGIMIDQSSGAAFRYYDPPKLPMTAAADAPPPSGEIAKGVTLLPESETPAAQPSPVAAAAVGGSPDKAIVRPAATRAAGSFPAAGIWECGIRTSNRTYKLQFVVGSSGSIVVTSYGNAAASVLGSDPLTFTALNPNGDRLTNFVWNGDDTMAVTGPSMSRPGSTFHDTGACTKV